MAAAHVPMKRMLVLVVDDEPLILRALSHLLRRGGYDVALAASRAEGERMLRSTDSPLPFLILTDLHLPDGTGLELLAVAKSLAPPVVTIVMTARATLSSAVEAIRQGAYDYLAKPLEDADLFLSVIDRAVEHKQLLDRARHLEEKLDEVATFDDIIGSSPAMQRMTALIRTVGPTDAAVLVSGESGTGKELVVRALHRRSRRKDRPLLAINCGALSESVLESELFGHVKGAFTGALTARKGLFEAANGGTVFLDEVGETPPSVQVRLLRVLQEREVKPVGSNETRTVDVRVIAATNRSLRDEVARGRFREDLFYRLNVVGIDVPPLRERLEDIPLLLHHFVAKHARRHGRTIATLSPGTVERLASSEWPGNVRQLENAVERAVVLSADTALSDIPSQGPAKSTQVARSAGPCAAVTFAEAKRSFERSYFEKLMLDANGSVNAAAKMAGLDRSNLRRLLKRFEVSSDDVEGTVGFARSK